MKYYRIVTEYDNALEHHGILGQKWGVRRYQNENGTLTPLGQQRLNRLRDKALAKEPDKYDPGKAGYAQKVANLEKSLKDPEAWVTDDMRNRKKMFESGNNVIGQLSKIEKDSSPQPVKKKLKLDNMTDQELRDAIGRANLEKQYNDLFAPAEQPKISKGRKFARGAIEVGGALIGTATTITGLMLAIRELRGQQ